MPRPHGDRKIFGIRSRTLAREFGETANWRALERLALPGISGDRITCWGDDLVPRTSHKHSLETMRTGIGGIVWELLGSRNS